MLIVKIFADGAAFTCHFSDMAFWDSGLASTITGPISGTLGRDTAGVSMVNFRELGPCWLSLLE
jgi:hypothetical protein